MTELIKQRLVGMLIVVIAGVMFIPDLLDGKKELVKEEFKKIPPKPEVEQSPIVADFPKQKVDAQVEAATTVSQETAQDDMDEGSEQNAQQSRVMAEAESQQSSASKAVEPKQNRQVSQQNTEVATNLTRPEPIKAQPEFEKTAWVLRLGTFRNKPNVDALMTKLEEAGVTPFVKPVEAKAGILYRVFVGPELDKSSLESAQKTLKELTGLDGKITQFQPVN